MSDLRELYQTVILDHNKHPRNQGAPPGANRHAQGSNPLCGDRLSVHVTLADGFVRDVGFEGQGCAISKASASLMTEAVKGRPVAETEELFRRFHELVTSDPRSTRRGKLGERVARAPERFGGLFRAQLAAVPDDVWLGTERRGLGSNPSRTGEADCR